MCQPVGLDHIVEDEERGFMWRSICDMSDPVIDGGFGKHFVSFRFLRGFSSQTRLEKKNTLLRRRSTPSRVLSKAIKRFQRPTERVDGINPVVCRGQITDN